MSKEGGARFFKKMIVEKLSWACVSCNGGFHGNSSHRQTEMRGAGCPPTVVTAPGGPAASTTAPCPKGMSTTPSHRVRRRWVSPTVVTAPGGRQPPPQPHAQKGCPPPPHTGAGASPQVTDGATFPQGSQGMDVLQGREGGRAGQLLPVLKGDPGHHGRLPRTAGPVPTLHTAGRGGALWDGSAPPGLHLTHGHTNATCMHMITRTPASTCLQAGPLGGPLHLLWQSEVLLEGSGRGTDRPRTCPCHSLTLRWMPAA